MDKNDYLMPSSAGLESPDKLTRVLVVNPYDKVGGAARAAYRIHRSLVDHGESYGITSRMAVYQKTGDDSTVDVSQPRTWSRFPERVRLRLASLRSRGFSTENPVTHSPALRTSGWGEELNATNADILNLQWVGQWQDHVPTLSIEEIGRIRKPIVWTLHDQWAFCGAEHYQMSPSGMDERFAAGYTRFNRPSHERGPDLNRFTWRRKQRAWKRPLRIVCPSRWMEQCVLRSAIMRDWPVSVIPYPIDLTLFRPLDQRLARHELGLPPNSPLIIFAAQGGTSDPRKGADLLFSALARLRQLHQYPALAELELVILGQDSSNETRALGFPVHFVGHVDNDGLMARYYSAADAMVLPSRCDNLPNTGIEAHACGTPVVAFRTSGILDIVEDRLTGALAEPFDVESLANAIAWVLKDPEQNKRLGAQARMRAESLWEPKRIAALYAEVFSKALNEQTFESIR